MQFQKILGGKAGKKMPGFPRLEFSEKISAGEITDLNLPRTLLAICQKPSEPSFWKLMDSFV